MSFVTVEKAWLAGQPQQRAPRRAMAGPGMGTTFLQSVGNVFSEALNQQYPGVGPLLNPGYYKEKAEEDAKDKADAAAAVTAASGGTPGWVVPAAIAGGVGVLALILVMTMGGGRASNPRRRAPTRRRRRPARRRLRLR